MASLRFIGPSTPHRWKLKPIFLCAIAGDLVSVYTSLGYYNAVSDVQFHPLDHIIAFCSFGDSHPVLVYQYDIKGISGSAVT